MIEQQLIRLGLTPQAAHLIASAFKRWQTERVPPNPSQKELILHHYPELVEAGLRDDSIVF